LVSHRGRAEARGELRAEEVENRGVRGLGCVGDDRLPRNGGGRASIGFPIGTSKKSAACEISRAAERRESALR
jgi:hypothetical protein